MRTDPPTLADAERALRDVFGHAALHSAQRAPLEALLAGRDVLVTMPTGAGKSLLYQLPAVLLDGLTLVISPLIALMKDQVDALQAKGVRAAFVNSSVEGREREARLQAAKRGELDLLFITPERFRSPRFIELMNALPITRLAVDEAHCISQWGHDFRPDYSRVGLYRAQLGSPPTIALTATATPRVARDIAAVLELRDPLIVRTGIERDNLYLGFERVVLAEDKTPHLAERIARLRGPGIVYSTLIRDLEALHDELARRGIQSLVYHGKLSARERRAMQERFMASTPDEPAVVLATNAFGMGVDKPDIRFVLHAQVPRTIEAWTQEVGRAGRDGLPSFCETLVFDEDFALQREFLNWANPDREFVLGVWHTIATWGERAAAMEYADLVASLLVKNRRDNRAAIALKWLEVVGAVTGSFERHDLAVNHDFMPSDLPEYVGSEAKRDNDLDGLVALARMAGGEERCRRASLAEHFELDADERCHACDVCTGADAFLDSNGFAATAVPKLGAVPKRSAEKKSSPNVMPPTETARAFPFQRGDWVRYGRHGMGRIVSVAERGKQFEVTIEDASSLQHKRINPAKVSLRPLE